jgi:raffinose/stachyose/melibiose transport system permease protein
MKAIKEDRMKIVKSVLIKITILILCLIEAYPIFWMLTASFKQQHEWVSKPAYALNSSFHFQNYIDAWTRGHMSTYFFNSLVATLGALFFIVYFSVTVGFALTKMRWKMRKKVALFFDMGIMVPIATALIPLFQIYNRANLLNSRVGLILVYIAFGLSLSFFLVSSYMRSLPREILEAAVIDGCDIYRLMWHIVMPLMKNAVMTILVLQFFFKWNDLLFSMTFISSSNLKTVQTGLLYFETEFGAKNWGAIFASVSMSVMPLLFIYILLNRRVIEGLTSGAVKG